MPFSKLLDGFRKFQATYFQSDNALYDKLVARGQSPEALVIACSDSRNDPALLTSSQPGDIFVVRNVAAIVPPYQPDGAYHGTSAAIEFAVKGLKVKNIMILGHALCGGVRTLAESTGQNNTPPAFEFLTQWIEIGAPARDAVAAALGDADENVRLRALEQAMILTSLNNIMTFPWIKSAVEKRQIKLHGWYFDMAAGQMLSYDFDKGHFIPLPRDEKQTAIGRKPGCACSDDAIARLIRHHAA